MYKQSPGKMNTPKTGAGIPSVLLQEIPTNKTSSSDQKTDDHVSGYKPLDKKHYFSENKDVDSQVVNAINMSAYKKDSIAHRNDDLRLNKLKPGSRVPGTEYIINDFNNETQSFEARKKGTMNKVSISRRDMVNRMKPDIGKNYEINPKKIETFANIRSMPNN
jgi:hypothetical protein